MILLVDDDPGFLEEARSLLEGDWRVLSARDAAQARSLLDAIGFSLALVDLNLPDCDGFQLIHEMHTAQPDLPIVAFSGVTSRKVLESAIAVGAADVLTKPVSSEWRATLKRLGGSREQKIS